MGRKGGLGELGAIGGWDFLPFALRCYISSPHNQVLGSGPFFFKHHIRLSLPESHFIHVNMGFPRASGV